MEAIYDSIKEHYTNKQTNEALISNSCFLASKPHLLIQKYLGLIPQAVHEKFYGCGSAVPLGIKGLTVLDLGSGIGRDVFLASMIVGEKGKVIGVDMTKNQVDQAKEFTPQFIEETKKANMNVAPIEFHEGFIEKLDEIPGITSESIDLITSNCVINLSPQKEKVLSQVYKVLKFGGEFVFSDIYSDRKIHPAAREKLSMIGSCIGTVYYVNDFLNTCKKVGFNVVREVNRVEIVASNQDMQKLIVGKAKFYSITYRLFKVKQSELTEEDYGHVVTYMGSIEGYPTLYKFDTKIEFESGKPTSVSGNVASAIEESAWLAKHFVIAPNKREFHYGEFKELNVGAQEIKQVTFQVPTCCLKP